MGFIDDARDVLGATGAAAQGKIKVAGLNADLKEVAKQRKELAAQLGAALFELVRDTPDLLAGREEIVSQITELDERAAAIEAEIAQVEADVEAAQQAASYVLCPRCGSRVSGVDKFCSGCGLPAEEARAAAAAAAAPEPPAPAALSCANCGNPVNPGDRFCMACGSPLGQQAPAAPLEPAAVPDAAPEVPGVPVGEQAVPADQPAPAEAPNPMVDELNRLLAARADNGSGDSAEGSDAEN